MTRPSWDEYFMAQCDLVATRGTCDRKQVGAIIVHNKRIIATGYNGSIPGQPHCDDPKTFWQCPKCGKKSYNQKDKTCFHFKDTDTWLEDLAGIMEKRTGGHDLEGGHCIRTIHAEQNAIAQAARLGISVEGATLYCNTFPCWNCFKLVVAAGIKEIVFKDEYPSQGADRVINTAKTIKGFILRQKE